MKTGFSLCGNVQRVNPVLALYWPCTGLLCSVLKRDKVLCFLIHTGKNLFSLQGSPVLIAGTPVFITGISL